MFSYVGVSRNIKTKIYLGGSSTEKKNREMLVHVWTRDKIFPPHIDKIQEKVVKAYFYAENYLSLTFWRRNYFFLILAHLYINVNNTGTKYVRIVKQTAL